MRQLVWLTSILSLIFIPLAHAQQFDVSNTSVNGKTLTAILGTPTGAMEVPSGTTAQEPDTGNPGELRYNTTTGRFEFGVGGAWDNFVRRNGDSLTGTFTGGTFSGLTLSGNVNGTPAWVMGQTFPNLNLASGLKQYGYIDATYEPGVDPTGTTDSTAGLEAALATGLTVYLPPGKYVVSQPLACAVNGPQRFYGDGVASQIVVSTNFSPTATGVLTASTSNDCQIDDMRITFAQPPDLVTTAVGAGTGDTIIVATPPAGQTINVGDYIYDASTQANIAAQTTVTAISGNTLTLSASAASIANGDSLHFAGSRSMATTLTQGCSLTPGSPACAYPPAVYASGAGLPAGLGRPTLENLRIESAWTGIFITGPGGGYDIRHDEVGALNNGLSIDDLADSGTIQNFKFWDFGFYSPAYRAMATGLWSDHTTECMTPGRTDGGSFKNLQCFLGNITLLPTFTWGSFNDVNLDGTGANFIIPAGVSSGSYMTITGLHAESSGTTSACLADISNGNVVLTGFFLNTSVAQSGLCVRGGSVTASGGHINDFDKAYPAVLETGGTLSLYTSTIIPSLGGQQVAPIQITGGTYHIMSNVVDGGTWGTTTVPFISITEACNGWTSNSIEGNSAYPTHPISGQCQGFTWPNSSSDAWYPGSQSGLVVPLVSTINPPQTDSTVGNSTFLNGHIFAGYLARLGTQTANFTDTTPSAAAIVSNFQNPVVNQMTKLRIANDTTYTETIAGGTGVTISGATTIAPGTWRDYMVELTNVTAGSDTVTFVSIGGGTN